MITNQITLFGRIQLRFVNEVPAWFQRPLTIGGLRARKTNCLLYEHNLGEVQFEPMTNSRDSVGACWGRRPVFVARGLVFCTRVADQFSVRVFGIIGQFFSCSRGSCRGRCPVFDAYTIIIVRISTHVACRAHTHIFTTPVAPLLLRLIHYCCCVHYYSLAHS